MNVVFVVLSRRESLMSLNANLNTDTAATAGECSRMASASPMLNALRAFNESGTPPLNWMPGRMRRM